MYKTIRFKIAVFICHIAYFLLPESVFKIELETALSRQACRIKYNDNFGLSLREQIKMLGCEDVKRRRNTTLPFM